jgi:xanthine/CO dehydrogenase XdhC/CoxF family maturation factor
MTGLLGILEAVQGLREPGVLATLVKVRGSSYRRPGARMLVGREGARSGTVSAGCLEADVLARAEAVLASGRSQLASYDMGSELDMIWGTGMGCGGQVEVLLERVAAGVPPPWMGACAAMGEQRRSGLLATVFDARGAAKDRCLDRLLWGGDGELLLPADPELSAVLAPSAREVLARGLPASETFAVGGELDVLLEPVLPPFALWIYGAGEHARPIARMAKGLGWFLGIADHRPALATAERFPEADRILVGPATETLKDLPLDGRSAALVLSHVHAHDRGALQALLPAPAAYLGLQGNRARCERLVREIEERLGGSIPAEQRAKLHHPAGLDLGAESPEAIALSMLSEIQAVLSGREGRSLRDGQGAIHVRPPVRTRLP